MLKKLSAFLLAVLTLCSALPVRIRAAESVEFYRSSVGNRTYSGDMLAAVSSSTDITRNSAVRSSFTLGETAVADPSPSSDAMDTGDASVYKIIEDPDTGEQLIFYTPDLPDPDPAELAEAPPDADMPLADYSVGNTRSVYGYYINSTTTLQCLYIGEKCTVWGSVSDDPKIRITSQIAREIATTFDRYCTQMMQAFADRWYDADKDGKIAIFCYDIDGSYTTNQTRVSGYFWSSDFTNQNAADCIHVDSCPLMGSKGYELSRVAQCYGTLVHEFQHLLNSSYVKFTSGLAWSETYINEAFSLAAEHLIFGEHECLDRIYTFNNYECGSYGLTAWYGTSYNYANSYLFGQYLRARYGQKTGTNGNTFFKKFLTSRTSKYNNNSLGLAAELLGTTSEQLILDFWAAVIRKEPTGNYGFAGESWSRLIQPKLSSLTTAGGTGDICPGGVRFYSLEDTGACTVLSNTGVNFISFPQTEKFSLTAAASDNGTFQFTDAKGNEITEAAIGTRVFISTAAASGYAPYAVYVDGRMINGSSFWVTGNHTVSVEFREYVKTYTSGGATITLFQNGTLRIYSEKSGGKKVYNSETSWTQDTDQVRVIRVENEINRLADSALSYFPNVTDLLLPSMFIDYSSAENLGKTLLSPTAPLKNVFYDGSAKDWNSLSGDKTQFADKMRFGLPVVVTIEGLQETYAVGSVPDSGDNPAAGYAVLTDGTKYRLGVPLTYDFSAAGTADVTLEFCGYAASGTVTVLTHHQAGISQTDGAVEVRLSRSKAESTAKNAIVAVYRGEKMVALHMVTGFEDGDCASFSLDPDSGYSIKVYWLTGAYSPVGLPAEKGGQP